MIHRKADYAKLLLRSLVLTVKITDRELVRIVNTLVPPKTLIQRQK